ncbi:heavy metal sensor histidine kinase [Cedecea neteri]|uniref:heavy metal sensor histidine kinase n=1 Tax=Cedecea neteri TaxID=158822 RepID=UPI0005D97140|nr:heavy metal sensor histidine kinase [Cedecea neteri]AJZ89509.1 histidine kinase [Klebsiella michiganensis]WPU25434.1 heavy metal sensor histidine kinase [Cedecea neteri]
MVSNRAAARIKISISTRMALMFALIMAMLMLMLALVMHNALLTSLQNQMQKELQLRHSLISPFITDKGTSSNWSAVQQKLNNISSSEGGMVNHWIISRDPRYSIPPLPAGFRPIVSADGFSTMPNPLSDSPIYLLISTLPPLGERPSVRYVVAIDSTPYMNTLSEFTQVLLLISVVAILLASYLGYCISRIGLRPVVSLSEQAHHLVPGHLSQRLDNASLPPELHNLANSFNGVLARQEVAWGQLESFNADVAHELRTPLTNLIVQTQHGLARDRSVCELKDLLQSNLEELERMTSIVNDMLFLSYAQAGQYSTVLSDILLREEALKTAEYVEPLFIENNITLEIIGDIQAYVDRRLFHRALANLLENSARYALPDTIVCVRLEKSQDVIRVEVTNSGEEIAPEHLSRLFERFYRIDSSRGQSNMHHGLGLSIVRAIALMHRGNVFAHSENGFNTFGFSLMSPPPSID